jgi:hypothetical protein
MIKNKILIHLNNKYLKKNLINNHNIKTMVKMIFPILQALD